VRTIPDRIGARRIGTGSSASRAVANYDVAPDGRRILASMAASDAAGRSIGMVLDWGGR
jgi:hypothetical protein